MIKTTLIGHASLLIQSKETTIVTDPVWSDYQWEELQVLCPSIVLERDKIPPVDVVNIFTSASGSFRRAHARLLGAKW